EVAGGEFGALEHLSVVSALGAETEHGAAGEDRGDGQQCHGGKEARGAAVGHGFSLSACGSCAGDRGAVAVWAGVGSPIAGVEFTAVRGVRCSSERVA